MVSSGTEVASPWASQCKKGIKLWESIHRRRCRAGGGHGGHSVCGSVKVSVSGRAALQLHHKVIELLRLEARSSSPTLLL